MKTIYISSTYKDLIKYRDAAYQALRKMGHKVICMEDYVAKDERTDERCKKDAADCDIYVGIFAWRYGYIPDDDNPLKMSITEMEYRAAKCSNRTTVLTFLLSDDIAWQPQMMDSTTGENEAGERIVRLRSELLKRSSALFRNPDDLAMQIIAAIYQDEATKRVSKIKLFNDNRSTLETSALSDIDDMIKEAEKVDVVEINLGRGKSWWTTRLHLAAALATDFTNIQQIVFVDDGNHLIGMYSPDQIRHALATVCPVVEIAYLQCIQKDDIPNEYVPSHIVFDIGPKLRELCDGKDEKDIKQWVTRLDFEHWMTGKRRADHVSVNQPSTVLQYQIVSSNSAFVALVDNDRLVQVIDRISMVTYLAKSIVQEQLH